MPTVREQRLNNRNLKKANKEIEIVNLRIKDKEGELEKCYQVVNLLRQLIGRGIDQMTNQRRRNERLRVRLEQLNDVANELQASVDEIKELNQESHAIINGR